MYPGVAPVAIQAMFDQGRLAACQFEQCAARRERDFGADGAGFGDGNRGCRDGCGLGVGLGLVEVFASAFQQRFGCVQANAQVAEAFDGQRVFSGLFVGGVNPWPGLGAHEVQRIFVGGAGDTGVDGRVENLRQGADWRWPLESALKRDHVLGRDEHIFEYY